MSDAVTVANNALEVAQAAGMKITTLYEGTLTTIGNGSSITLTTAIPSNAKMLVIKTRSGVGLDENYFAFDLVYLPIAFNNTNKFICKGSGPSGEVGQHPYYFSNDHTIISGQGRYEGNYSQTVGVIRGVYAIS